MAFAKYIKISVVWTFVLTISLPVQSSVETKDVSVQAVTMTFEKERDAYIKVHRACHKIWGKNYKRFIANRASLSVEVVTLHKKPNRITALCVAKK